ncbi:MAG: hypothetical protein LBG59_07195 [Candidatus Peribacteria bacterium]|jgi:hypothetical protein|nr:hypothetical protein [Candidatus Peribacteria bacterium]
MLPAEIIFRNPEYPLNSIGINATKGAGATLTFEGISVEETYATMKEKELFKQVEKLLNSFDIPLRHYGNPQIARADEFYINMFYPFLIQEKYPVWSTFDHPLGITVVYNITLNEVSITAIDIAKYEYVNYPTLSKEEILKDFSLSGEKLVAPELIYLVKHLEGEMYYVPGLRFALENGAAVYKALVEL